MASKVMPYRRNKRQIRGRIRIRSGLSLISVCLKMDEEVEKQKPNGAVIRRSEHVVSIC